ncbi:DUF4885 domain-containing protein [Halalkalibacterium halodurans]|uniref:DUF4885 domain-containing protein n=1 Tax=Halalkalibacterium halodurans TaxID=86665 RepID=UPI002E1B1346|nr:DUF4885 domain-containing protein [Halalkalibacterium halodurans]MED4083842.1 DUF4885 domain-containing protein [Halalkalibacterium halodurans]MED4105479.1 DUF4885 domain-containing protein [Halalkalibacterium halodurans]MED4109315.1 DUF4885 domain-containing protein [Halalkalibacterium halodurans]MED4122479.1 DUF4885 domain-containing protein [Halalkalibacterium halodurans]
MNLFFHDLMKSRYDRQLYINMMKKRADSIDYSAEKIHRQYDTVSISQKALDKQNVRTMGSQMNGLDFLNYSLAQDRERLSKTIQDHLYENGIHLEKEESFTIDVSYRFQITVTGLSDKEKAKQIEAVLNQTNIGFRLLEHDQTVKSFKNGASVERTQMYDKWHADHFLRQFANTTIEDVSLNQNGKLTGNDELNELMEKASRGKGELNEYVQAMIAKVRAVLLIGIDHIPNRSATFTYSDELQYP